MDDFFFHTVFLHLDKNVLHKSTEITIVLVLSLTETFLLQVCSHGENLEALIEFLFPTHPWTCSSATGSGSCCHLEGSARGQFVSWATCRGRQISTLGWSCTLLMQRSVMDVTRVRATLNGKWSHFPEMHSNATNVVSASQPFRVENHIFCWMQNKSLYYRAPAVMWPLY